MGYIEESQSTGFENDDFQDPPYNTSPRVASPKRLTEFPFPPYSYVSGLHPHPLSDPTGHGCEGNPAAPTVAPTENTWHQCQAYLWGLDLFNAGFYWESHESWEAAWLAAGREGATADFLKALIKIAAAGVKAREGRVEGVHRHLARATELLGPFAESEKGSYFGLDVLALQSAIATTGAQCDEVVTAARKAPDEHVLPIELNCKL